MRTTLTLIAVFLSGASLAHAQKATEIFIPIGECPGLSHKYTVIGSVGRVDGQNKTFTITGSVGTQTFKITEQTRIWLDRSQLKLPNQVGTLTDCQKGRPVEVKFLGNERKDSVAEWIKVRIPRSGAEGQRP